MRAASARDFGALFTEPSLHFQEVRMASLCLLDENGIMARRWELGDKPITVGRGVSADVVINDATLSRQHFVVERDGTTYLLKDLRSQNGTWVDGKPAKTTPLHHHDCILAGRTIFLFSAASPGTDPGSKTEVKKL